MTDLSFTATEVTPVVVWKQFSGPASEALSAGQYVRLNTSTGKVEKGNATTAAEARRGGIALTTAENAGQAVTVMEEGILDVGAALNALAYDQSVYLSDTDAVLADASGTITKKVGKVVPAWGATTADKLLLVDPWDFEAGDLVASLLSTTLKTGFIPVPLTALREVASNAIPNLAAHGGILASDSTPILNLTNGDTDSALRLSWAASNSDAVTFQMALPPDLNEAAAVEIHLRAAMAGTTDTPVIDADSFFNEGDTKVEDASAAITGATVAEYTISIAAADVPAGAQTLSFELTPGAHTTDILYVYAIWVEYTRM